MMTMGGLLLISSRNHSFEVHLIRARVRHDIVSASIGGACVRDTRERNRDKYHLNFISMCNDDSHCPN